MALIITEEQKMLKDSASELFAAKAPVSQMRHLRDEGYLPFDPELWEEMVAMGWTALTIPEDYNGLDFGYVGLGQILQESGKTLSKSPLISSILLAASALKFSDNEMLKAKWLPELMNGTTQMTMAIDEKSYFDPKVINTTATKSGEHYLLNGKKTFVIDGTTASQLIVVVKMEDSSTGLFLVDSATEGIAVHKNILMDAGVYSDVTFENVAVPAEQQLNVKVAGATIFKNVLEIAYVGLSAEMMGITEQAFAMTIQYLKERQQFGVLIGTYQALQHRAAKMFSEIELCKSIVLKALQAIDTVDEQRSKYASLAKAKLGVTIKLVTNEAIQMHGGIGVTDDADIGFYMKRARVLQQLFGDYNYHLDVISRFKGF